MVVDYAELGTEDVDRIFHALADRTRRDIITRAMGADHSVSSLADHYTMSFAAVQKHVAVLERAQLITKHRRGREQLVRSNVATIQRAQQLLEQLELFWRDRIDRFATVLDEHQTGATP